MKIKNQFILFSSYLLLSAMPILAQTQDEGNKSSPLMMFEGNEEKANNQNHHNLEQRENG